MKTCVNEKTRDRRIVGDVARIVTSRHEIFLRNLNQISIERDISETCQKYLKRDDFFVTSLTHSTREYFEKLTFKKKRNFKQLHLQS